MRRRILRGWKLWNTKHHIKDIPQNEVFILCAYKWILYTFPKSAIKLSNTTLEIVNGLKGNSMDHYMKLKRKGEEMCARAIMRKTLLILANIPRRVIHLIKMKKLKKFSKYFNYWQSKAKWKITSKLKLKQAIQNNQYKIKKVCVHILNTRIL